jgi:hypothetical protein
MFTWICPQCGKEVPPHENECPVCSGKEAPAAPAPEAPSPPPPKPFVPPQPQYEALRPAAPPAQPVYVVGGQSRGMPGWVVALLVAILACGLGLAGYHILRSRGAAPPPKAESPFESVPQTTSGTSRVAKFIEVTGFRITEDDKKRTQIQFLVVNHSAADIGDLAGVVRLRTTESKPGEDPFTTFEFKTTRLGPYESIDFKTMIRTNKRAYELPDWQFLRADVEITSPAE